MKSAMKGFRWGAIALAFALIVSASLCHLEHENRKTEGAIEQACASIAVKVYVTNLTGNRRNNLQISGWVGDIFQMKNMTRYTTDLKMVMNHEINDPECGFYGYRITAATTVDAVQMLDPYKGSTVIYYPGYDASLFQGDEFVCLIPQWLENSVGEDGTIQISLCCYHESHEKYYTQEFAFAVAGTYDTVMNQSDEKQFYCPYGTLSRVQSRMGCERVIDNISAMLIDNSTIDEFKEYAYMWFAEVDPSGEQTEWGLLGHRYYPYALDIDDTELRRVNATLKTSLAINAFASLMVFILSAGAGFFLGFLMIRSRKREIILMRTLGRANFSIYLSYALEQMLCILAGVALGGLAFRWEPVRYLCTFAGIYFVGLSAALILFLNSRLLTTVKEDE